MLTLASLNACLTGRGMIIIAAGGETNTMNKRVQHQIALDALWSDAPALLEYLAAQSNLPGPRGNLEMMAAFADLAGVHGADAWPLLERLAAVSADEAPTNDPREVLPCCAAQGFGAVGAAVPAQRERALAALRVMAIDARWRTRESVAMGLQRLLVADFEATALVVAGWARSGDPLVMRAAVAGLAEPAVLTDSARAGCALDAMACALDWLRAPPAERRRDEPVRTLRQALGYALSVATAADPEGGFALMSRAAAWGDRDVDWVLKQNLSKRRLAAWPERVAQVMGRLRA